MPFEFKRQTEIQTSIEKPKDVMIKETDICVVSLVMEDCKVISLADPGLLQALSETDEDHLTASKLGSWVKMTDLGMGWS